METVPYQQTALGYSKEMVEQDPALSLPEALHWLADSSEASELFIEEMAQEAEVELKAYPSFEKNFWWVK